MGRYAGWIALYAGVARRRRRDPDPRDPVRSREGRAVASSERDAWGAHFSIVVVAEGAKAKGGSMSLSNRRASARAERLGGMGHRVAAELEEMTGRKPAWSCSATCSAAAADRFDRVLATRFGGKAVEILKAGETDRMVAFEPPDIGSRRRSRKWSARRARCRSTSTCVRTAEAIGVTFGD